MWIFALTTLGVIVVSVFGLLAVKNLRARPVWLTASEGEIASVPDGTDTRSAGPRETVAEASVRSKNAEVTRKDLWEDRNYFWVVVCKNGAYHRHSNLYNVHRIPLGETDAAIPGPPVFEPFVVRCDECGKDYSYKPVEVLRYEMEVPALFFPHKLFKE